jgi:hypothetical protein
LALLIHSSLGALLVSSSLLNVSAEFYGFKINLNNALIEERVAFSILSV